jgi:hypothetical protein
MIKLIVPKKTPRWRLPGVSLGCFRWLLVQAPKGRNKIAQGNALGFLAPISPALKGRNKQTPMGCCALSGLGFCWWHFSPGRCPGLSCCAPLGLENDNRSRRVTPRRFVAGTGLREWIKVKGEANGSDAGEMAMKRRWKLWLALVLAIGGLFSLPAVYWRVIGRVKGEAFYKGRPTSYWRDAILAPNGFFGPDA